MPVMWARRWRCAGSIAFANSAAVSGTAQCAPMATSSRDFFISYATRDEAWATWIAWQLEDADHSTYLQAWDFVSGTNWVLEMQSAVTTCARTICVLTPRYLESVYAQPEWATAFALDPLGRQRKIIPVMVEKCRPTGLLSQIVYVDITGLAEQDARRALARAIRTRRAKPRRAPQFPVARAAKTSRRPLFPLDIPRPGPDVVREIDAWSLSAAMDKARGERFLRHDLDAR